MARRNWEKGIWQLVEKGEKVILRVIIFGLVFLVTAQALLTTDSMGLYLSWAERLEGKPFSTWSGPAARVMETESAVFGYITLEMKDYSSLAQAYVIINGEKAADFRSKRVIVKVFSNDVVEVDGSFYQRPLKFSVVDISHHLSKPVLHQTIETQSSVALLGKVQFK